MTAPGETVEDVLRRCREGPGTVSVWVGSPGGPADVAVAVDHVHMAASTMKLAVLVAAHRALEAGALRPDLPVRVHTEFASAVPGRQHGLDRTEDSDEDVWDAEGTDVPFGWLVRRMVVRSSNLATDLVLERVGLAASARVLVDAGCTRSVLQRGIEDHPARDAGLTFAVTAADLAGLLGALVTGRLLGPRASAEALATLRAQERVEDVVAGLPPGTSVAHKNGWVDGVRHSAALVEPAAAPSYVQVVLTSTGRPDDDACALVADLTRAVWAARTAPARPAPRTTGTVPPRRGCR